MPKLTPPTKGQQLKAKQHLKSLRELKAKYEAKGLQLKKSSSPVEAPHK